MADSFPPTIAPQTDNSSNAPEAAQQAPDPAEPVPITEQEVGEYREQDRYLPVSRLPPEDAPAPRLTSSSLHQHLVAFFLWGHADRKCLAHHEERRATNGENSEGRQGVRAGVRVGVHQLYHVRSGGEVPT